MHKNTVFSYLSQRNGLRTVTTGGDQLRLYHARVTPCVRVWPARLRKWLTLVARLHSRGGPTCPLIRRSGSFCRVHALSWPLLFSFFSDWKPWRDPASSRAVRVHVAKKKKKKKSRAPVNLVSIAYQRPNAHAYSLTGNYSHHWASRVCADWVAITIREDSKSHRL